MASDIAADKLDHQFGVRKAGWRKHRYIRHLQVIYLVILYFLFVKKKRPAEHSLCLFLLAQIDIFSYVDVLSTTKNQAMHASDLVINNNYPYQVQRMSFITLQPKHSAN